MYEVTKKMNEKCVLCLITQLRVTALKSVRKNVT